MIKPLFATILAALLIVAGCSQRAFVRFKQKPAELNSSDALTQIMLVNKSPKIVLRVPNTRNGVTNSQAENQPVRTGQRRILKAHRSDVDTRDIPLTDLYDVTALYNAIEKQLFKEGFSVRDRALFNQVLPSDSYAKIGTLTNTDLILELVSIERPVGYNTNMCYVMRDGAEVPTTMRQNYQMSGGVSVEFKLVSIKANEVVGNYRIHYTPCTDNSCRGYYKKSIGFRQSFWKLPGELNPQPRSRKKVGTYEIIDQNALELFMADATHQLVQTMR